MTERFVVLVRDAPAPDGSRSDVLYSRNVEHGDFESGKDVDELRRKSAPPMGEATANELRDYLAENPEWDGDKISVERVGRLPSSDMEGELRNLNVKLGIARANAAMWEKKAKRLEQYAPPGTCSSCGDRFNFEDLKNIDPETDHGLCEDCNES